MAIEFDIQVQNGTVKITVGGQPSNPDDGSRNTGGGARLRVPVPAAGEPRIRWRQRSCRHRSHCDLWRTLGNRYRAAGWRREGCESRHGWRRQAASPGTGGGGKAASPGTGGGAHPARSCAPVVIGPIVISGCYSGQESGDLHQMSEAVTVNPPAQVGVGGAPARPFTMQYQQQTNWCWAAVAVSVHDYFTPPEALVDSTITQPALATQLLKDRGIRSPQCDQTPVSTVCNQPQALDVALAITRNLRLDGALANKHLTFECIHDWVTAQLPVAARIKWRGEGAHFIALDGCKLMSSGQQLVHVQDPNSHTSPTLWDYDALVENYQEDGYWIDTYLLTATNPQH